MRFLFSDKRLGLENLNTSSIFSFLAVIISIEPHLLIRTVEELVHWFLRGLIVAH